ncbi:hypothetical protein H5410_040797 [Solanum commersonii]|uniref:Uncharacterized protein n=1 Tax=Solanum commersonii TaxID=4109 RepID=A0A9J5XPT9_SOLCO|nr:hypothetical protein H5410_040797 [Solanum commersonii]
MVRTRTFTSGDYQLITALAPGITIRGDVHDRVERDGAAQDPPISLPPQCFKIPQFVCYDS